MRSRRSGKRPAHRRHPAGQVFTILQERKPDQRKPSVRHRQRAASLCPCHASRDVRPSGSSGPGRRAATAAHPRAQRTAPKGSSPREDVRLSVQLRGRHMLGPCCRHSAGRHLSPPFGDHREPHPKELTSALHLEFADGRRSRVSTAPEGAHFGTRCRGRSNAPDQFQLLPKELTSALDAEAEATHLISFNCSRRSSLRHSEQPCFGQHPVSTAPEGAHFGTRLSMFKNAGVREFQLLPKELTSAPVRSAGITPASVSTAPEGAHFGTVA